MVPEKDKKLVQRWSHGAAAVTVNSDCGEVILFGGRDKNSSLMADTVVVRLGECLEYRQIPFSDIKVHEIIRYYTSASII